MPNWCNNRLSVVGPKDEVRAFVKRAQGVTQHYAPHVDSEKEEDFSFHQLVPIPDDVMKMNYDPHGISAERRLWGVKWGGCHSVLESHTDGLAIYVFDTPWGPPDNLLVTISSQHPKLTFVISYAEESPTRGRYAVRGLHTIDNTSAGVIPEPDQPEEPASEKTWDEYYEGPYAEWHNEFLNSHNEWTEKNIINERALRELLE